MKIHNQRNVILKSGQCVKSSRRGIMKNSYKIIACLMFSWLVFVCSEKYRICVVDAKGEFKRSATYCPRLDNHDSPVECVVALDRLDCLRRIHKGDADFSVFTAEDLVAATNSEIEVLITNELRSIREESYEYQIVAVIDNKSGISSKHDLKGKKYCHPGYGDEADWTKILANYFEASVVTPQCDTRLTITENRIKATAEFFKSSCKGGPWVNNPLLDQQLKAKYRNLCNLCGNPYRCSMDDNHWGRRGSLLCLTDGAGDISWARLDDVRQHFGLTPGGYEASPKEYSLLCPDDTVMPVNSTNPCVWVVKPWSVVATRRTKAQEIQAVISSLSHENISSWKSSLLNLIEFSYAYINKLDPIEPIESYLHRATGFLRANSFSACHPPRTIRICTTSNIENSKCAWLRESAAVYGIEPDLECIKADNTTHCMVALNDFAADVVMVPSDLVHLGHSKYNLKALFYETVRDNDKYIAVPVVRHDSNIVRLEDLKGKSACFPIYDGVAWNSVKYTLQNKSLIKSCPLDLAMKDFFGPSCVPGLSVKEFPEYASLTEKCQPDFDGEFGALHCLTSGVGEVAFVSKNSLEMFVSDEREDNPGSYEKMENFKFVCETKSCFLSWAPLGQAMVRSNSTDLWLRDTLDVFQQLDNLFGKNYASLTTPFTMFGKYNGKSNILFHDATVRLKNVETITNTDTMANSYGKLIKQSVECIPSTSSWFYVSRPLILLVVMSILVG